MPALYKNFLIVPDSFKGTMSAIDVCRIMAETLQERFPEVHIDTIPMADGGEGTVDAFLAANSGERITCEVCGPYREPVEGFYGMLEDGTAVIEMAAAAGLPLVGQNRRADKTTTFGVGQLLLDALDHGAKKVIMGLGGSCTNEGGVGMAAACGVKLLYMLALPPADYRSEKLNFCALRKLHNFVNNLVNTLLIYFTVADRTVRNTYSCIKKSQIIVNFRNCSDS